MLLWVIKQAVISAVLIILVHYIYIFFRDTLTVPKLKDLVNKPQSQYREIYKSLQGSERPPPAKPATDMKAELQSYLQKLSKEKPTEPAEEPTTDGDAFHNPLDAAGSFGGNCESF